MTDVTPDRGACRWITTYEHALLTASKRRPGAALVRCCACGNQIEYTASWVTVAFGAHGNRLPLPVFIHCAECSLILDPTAAWMGAYRKDQKAALPDPEKVQREKELADYLAQQNVE